jgi:hypothetical protein
VSHPGFAVAATSAAVAVAVVLVVLLTGRGSERRAGCRSALIPAYLPPGAVADLVRSSKRPRMVIINPHNGPGAEAHASYRRAVRDVQAAGTRVLGYVATGYGARPQAEAAADAERYAAWYGVDGIFFDEASSDAAQLPYYRALAQGARADVGRTVVLNPGTVPARGYFDVADVVVTFEGTYAGYASAVGKMPDWLRALRPDRVAHLVYGATRAQAIDAVGAAAAGYVYVTSGVLPNPWRTVPAYLQEEEEVLASCR